MPLHPQRMLVALEPGCVPPDAAQQGSQMAQPVAGGGPGLDQYEHPKVGFALLTAPLCPDAGDGSGARASELHGFQPRVCAG